MQFYHYMYVKRKLINLKRLEILYLFLWASTSALLENLEEMFSLYYTDIDNINKFIIFNHTQVCDPNVDDCVCVFLNIWLYVWIQVFCSITFCLIQIVEIHFSNNLLQNYWEILRKYILVAFTKRLNNLIFTNYFCHNYLCYLINVFNSWTHTHENN